MRRKDSCLPCTFPSVIGFARGLSDGNFDSELVFGGPFLYPQKSCEIGPGFSLLIF